MKEEIAGIALFIGLVILCGWLVNWNDVKFVVAINLFTIGGRIFWMLMAER